ncbi:MAG: helix-turn-helix domain-containing protein [Ideonella sp.]|nr:helix-turn-helix domain-containing protein [Ideonella sp.]
MSQRSSPRPRPAEHDPALPAGRPLRIAVLAFDRISPFHLAVPCVLFGDRHPGAPVFDLRVCAAESGPLRTTAGFEVHTRHGLATLRWADWVIVPSWRDPSERPAEAVLKALVAAHRRGALVVGLCLGAFLLAEAGLLDGEEATTHWSAADEFARRYPAVRLKPGVLYVDAGQVITSAGTAAGLDCGLHLLRRYFGANVANRVARRLVVAPHRQGGQAQFIEHPLPDTQGDARIAALLDRVRASLADNHDLDHMADGAAMSRRSFTRHFRKVTGTTPKQWLLSERLALAQRLLEATAEPVERIAQRVGFASATVLRHHMRRAFGLTPVAWRQGFSGPTNTARRVDVPAIRRHPTIGSPASRSAR